MKKGTQIALAVFGGFAVSSGSAMAALPIWTTGANPPDISAKCADDALDALKIYRGKIQDGLARKKITDAQRDTLMATLIKSGQFYTSKAKLFKTPDGSFENGFATPADCKDVQASIDAMKKSVNALVNAGPKRWERSFAALQTIAHEGMEVKRVTAAENKAILDNIAKYRALVVQRQQDGLSEAEEDLIDNDIMLITEALAKYISDAQRKQAAAASTTTASTTAAAAAGGAASAWIAVAGNGTTPANAVEVGGAGANLIQVCRAKGTDGIVRPGKAFKNNCYLFENEKELKVDGYDALVMQGTVWLAAAGGVSPAKAVEGGAAVAGSPVHICRTKLTDNLMHSGMAYKGACYVGFGGKGLRVTTFEVLATK